MITKKIWRRDLEERRERRRVAADFYAIELDGQARYLRRVTNVSRNGLLLENPLADERPGQTVELELPIASNNVDANSADDGARARTMRVQAEVVYVTPDGRVGLHVTSARLPVENLGGRVPL
jgi:hypothetical protein